MGWPEIAVVVIVAVLVFGPDKLPDLARQAGQMLRTVRQMVDNAKSDLADEMGEDFAGLKDLNLRDLDPREVVRRNIVEAMEGPRDRPSKSAAAAADRPLEEDETPPFDDEST
ncbi:sec-independent translocase [Solicola sp. PLA-1-18]|uniref:sec-independent translocase n=1 Tax=Solicola sp. PLA-1-18 TaxID=3380532 RepID=UPI003B7A4278